MVMEKMRSLVPTMNSGLRFLLSLHRMHNAWGSGTVCVDDSGDGCAERQAVLLSRA